MNRDSVVVVTAPTYMLALDRLERVYFPVKASKRARVVRVAKPLDHRRDSSPLSLFYDGMVGLLKDSWL